MTLGAWHASFAAANRMPLADRKRLLGGKGAALVRMTEMGLPVPPGFTLTTEACARVEADGWFGDLDAAIAAGIIDLEVTSGRVLGSPVDPLLVSVRSGAAVSMPGMMDTVLNVGMTDDVAVALGRATGDERFAWDTARRFIQSYSSIVLGVPPELLARLSADALGPDEGRSLVAVELATATGNLRDALSGAGFEIPPDPARQVTEAVAAVFTSWSSDRARTYRRVEGIDDGLGTAATIQMMTFGNLGERSGTGVAFTRDPSSGERTVVGDFMVGAQGEDVVAGTHATLPLAALRSRWPEIADQLDAAAVVLEQELADMADIEFTVEQGEFWLLQVRRGKRSATAALRIAIDLAEDPGFSVTRAEALASVADILRDPPTRTNPSDTVGSADSELARGLPASPGRVTGRVCVDIDDAIAAGARGESIILVRRETSPADIAGIAEAAGIVTTLGGLVSHAAVVARSWGIPAIVGASDITVGTDGVDIAGTHYPTGTVLTVDGGLGTVLLGDHPADAIEVEEVAILRRWQADLAAVAAPSSRSARPVRESGEFVEAATTDACERVLALKGAATADMVADVLGCARAAVDAIIEQLAADELVQSLPGGRVRPLAPVIARVDERFRADAARLRAVIEPRWEGFHDLNLAFKQVVVSWQVRTIGGSEQPNDHADTTYDTAVVERLRAEIHAAILPIVDVIAAAEPRFVRYSHRLGAALRSVEAGDREMFAHPLKDSYHTVWFELHEELIRLTGRSRADEAAAGRA